MQVIKFSEDDEKIVEFFFTKFSSFAKGDINNHSIGNELLIEWPLFNSNQRKQMMEINLPFRIVSDPDQEICEFWDEIGYIF